MFIRKHLFITGLFICTLLNYSTLQAHAVVTATSIKVEPITAHHDTQVTVDFNSHIEIALSQVFLVRRGDKQELLNIIKGNKPGQIIIDMPALINGEYALRFKVFAADGHFTEDIVHFYVTE